MRRYGLIGYPLSHSFSQTFFTEKFQREGLQDCIYENHSIAAIEELQTILAAYPDMCGLNVTIPYKEKIIPFLQKKNNLVEATGACNCIKIKSGKLTGYNTDVIGFERSLLEKLQPHHDKALILGTGGAAKAVKYVLDKLEINFIEVSRNNRGNKLISYEEITEDILQVHTLIINTSPVGMYPKTEESPILPYHAITAKHFLFDLIYNPAKTTFLKKGEEKGAIIKNGWDMLVIQAEESWKIWNE